ncbi:type II toxin-antitoxin system HigB family toxin [Pseudobacter ginsenosidimutans]|nr:type II toxin-antitoxin system HigB family toxin [Pseudobacter ginsenosidimutans]QEC42374.1 type II toxin-antitoxin system HigB family toxin [Pseudobacter ginsenosidimutans]
MKKVHLVKEETLKKYVKESAVLRSAARHWLFVLGKARWQVPSDLKSDFGAADFLGNGSCRVVFDLGGNKFRMICKYEFGRKFVHLYIRWIGTHAAYDELCKKNLQYTIQAF